MTISIKWNLIKWSFAQNVKVFFPKREFFLDLTSAFARLDQVYNSKVKWDIEAETQLWKEKIERGEKYIGRKEKRNRHWSKR